MNGTLDNNPIFKTFPTSLGETGGTDTLRNARTYKADTWSPERHSFIFVSQKQKQKHDLVLIITFFLETTFKSASITFSGWTIPYPSKQKWFSS